MTNAINASQTHVVLVGISQTRTPAHLRERVHLGPEDAAALAHSLAGDAREAVVFTTCNRTELYLAAPDVTGAVERARLALIGLGRTGALDSTMYVRTDDEAVRHLCRVACGLESIVLGDTDVASQVRSAHETALRVGATGRVLDRLFTTALIAAKRVRSETSLSTAPASIPAAAIAVAANACGPMEDVRVLVVGAGRMARRAALNLRSRGCADIVVANRTIEHARELADRVDGRAAELSRLPAEVAAADIVVVAAGGRGFMLTAEHAAAAARERAGRSLVILDLGLPRNVDPSFREVSGCRLFNLDDLGLVVAATHCRRNAEVDAAEAFVQVEADRFSAWQLSLANAPAIARLRREGEEARQSVLARHATALARLDAADRRLVEAVTSQLVSKLLHAPTLALRGSAVESGS